MRHLSIRRRPARPGVRKKTPRPAGCCWMSSGTPSRRNAHPSNANEWSNISVRCKRIREAGDASTVFCDRRLEQQIERSVFTVVRFIQKETRPGLEGPGRDGCIHIRFFGRCTGGIARLPNVKGRGLRDGHLRSNFLGPGPVRLALTTTITHWITSFLC